MSAADDKARGAEPDRLEGFLSPRETVRLFGHHEAKAELLDAVRSSRMPPAWLLTGQAGIGKATLAYWFARALFGGGDTSAEGAQPDAVFSQTASLSHPNLLLLRRSWDEQNKRWKQVIAVDEARRLRSFFAGSAARQGWRVVIVDSAEDLNDSSANALLKSVEEPPEKAVFLIVCHAPGRLPVTIRSRCRALRLSPPTEDEMRQAVTQAWLAARNDLPHPDDEDMAILLSEGSIRRALVLLGADGIALYRDLLALIGQMPALDGVRAHQLADRLSVPAAQDRFETAYALLMDLLARLMREAATGRGALGEERPLARRLIRAHSLARWAELWETLTRAKADAVALNLPKRSLLLETFFRISETARDRAA